MSSEPRATSPPPGLVARMAAEFGGRSRATSPGPPTPRGSSRPTSPAPGTPTPVPGQNRLSSTSIRDLIKSFDQPQTQQMHVSPLKPRRSSKPPSVTSSSPVPFRQLAVDSALDLSISSAPSTPNRLSSIRDSFNYDAPLPATPTQSRPATPSSAPSPIVSRISKKLRVFGRKRVLPTIACAIALHLISPRLSTKLWILVYKILLRKKLMGPDETTLSFGLNLLGGLLMPLVVIAVAAYMFGRRSSASADSSTVQSHKVSDSVKSQTQSTTQSTPSLVINKLSPVLEEKTPTEELTPTADPVEPVPPIVVQQVPDVEYAGSTIDSIEAPKPLDDFNFRSSIQSWLTSTSTKTVMYTNEPELMDSTHDDRQNRFSSTSSDFGNSQNNSMSYTLRNSSLYDDAAADPNPDLTKIRPSSQSMPLPLPVQPHLQTSLNYPLQTEKYQPHIPLRSDSLTSETSEPTTPKMRQYNEETTPPPQDDFVADLDPETINNYIYSRDSASTPGGVPVPLPNTRLSLLAPSPTHSLARHPKRGLPTAGPTSLLFNNPTAHSLDYISMNLATLPTDFLPHFNLTRLHLAGNNLLELPDGTLALLPALQFLDVSDNRISSLRKSLGSCKGLKEVYARNCGLVVVEEGVLEGLDNLEVLDLSVNQLSSFSNFAFANNTAHLHTLILSNNKLRTLPPSLGLHRGRELVFLLIGGNNFEQSLKIFTDPIITASQATVSRVTKDISARLTVVPDSDLSGAQFSSMGLSSGVSFLDRSERGSLYEWGDDDDDLRSVHDAEFDGGYRKPSEFRDKLRRRSSLPDMFRADNRRSGTAASISAARRSGEYGSAINHPGWGEALEANSATSYHASTNPSYVYIQRLLSHLHDVFDLSPQFHPLKVSVQRIGSMVETSRNGSTHEEFSGTVPVTGLGDDPDAEHLTEEERDRIRKRQSPVRRANIAAEILSTERTYVNELKTLVSLYADPLERGILTASDMGAMFSNLKSILYFHKSHMLPNIERAIQDPDQPLGSVFNEAAPFFKMYSMYFNNFDTANEMVIHLEQLAASGSGQLQSPIRSTVLASTSISPTNSTQTSRRTLAKKFKNLVKIAKSSSSHSQISLQSYLILPVQRLPRYKLLVDQLLESTPLNHPDRASLASAAEAIRNCVAECNDKKREMEEYERGMKQMTRIRTVKNKSTGALSKFSTVKIGRQFIQEATLRLVKYVERQHLSNTEGIGADMAFAMTSNRDKFFRSVVGAVVETRFAMGSSGPISNIPPPVAVTGQPHLGAGLDAVSVYGLQRTVGADFGFLLFTDVLCWCKPISGSMSSSPLAGGGSGISEAEFELIRAIDIGPHTKVEVMVVLSNPEPVGPTRLADRPNSMSIDHLRAYAAVNGTDPASQRLSGGMLTLTNTRGSTATNTPVIREPDSVLRISDNDSVLYLRAGQSEVESWLETLKGLGCVQDE